MKPDQVLTYPHGTVEIFNVGGVRLGHTTFQPGWHWATDVKPVVGTTSCQTHHVGIALSGKLHVRMDDGTESELHAGGAYDIPPGHDGWVIGDDPWVTVDYLGPQA